MLRDMEFFKTKLHHIDGFGDTADELVEIIKSKQVKSASPPPPPPSEKKSSEEEPAEVTKQESALGEKKISMEKTDAAVSEVKNGE